jgi:hypothetical protein
MKPTPKIFASRLAPHRNKLTQSLPLFRPSARPSMSHRFPQAPFSVFATAPSTPSRLPATLVRLKLVRCPHSLAPTLVVLPSMSLGPAAPFASSRSRTPAVLFSTIAVAYDVFLPRKHPSGFPSMSHCLIRFQPEKPHPLGSAHPCRSHPSGSIETRSLPTLARCFPRSFTFYVADPVSSIPAGSVLFDS